MAADWIAKVMGEGFGKTSVDEIVEKICRENHPAKQLIDLALDQGNEPTYRLAWVLEHAVKKDPGWFLPWVSYFSRRYPEQDHSGSRRHFARIMTLLLSAKESRSVILREDTGAIVTATFEWLLEPGEAVAVQVNCLEVLFLLADQADWLADELRAHIPFLMSGGTAAMQSRGKKLLAKLGRH